MSRKSGVDRAVQRLVSSKMPGHLARPGLAIKYRMIVFVLKLSLFIKPLCRSVAVGDSYGSMYSLDVFISSLVALVAIISMVFLLYLQ